MAHSGKAGRCHRIQCPCWNVLKPIVQGGRVPAQNSAVTPSLYHLIDPEVLADPYPLYHRLRSERPVHWDPFLHSWVVTRYSDVIHVLHHFSADRTPTPEQLTN